jgi:hypothetical protein
MLFHSALSATTASEWGVFRRFCALKSGISLFMQEAFKEDSSLRSE